MPKINNYEWVKINLPSGWTELGRKMIEECEAAEPNFEIIDLKEKWGSIRVSYYPYTDKLRDIVYKYEHLSKQTCCKCGKPAIKISTGWVLPWCDKCGTDEEKYYKRFNE